MSDKIFMSDGGWRVSKPNEDAPDFVIANIGIKLSDFALFVKKHQDGSWMNIQVKVSRDGKYYAELDTWKPKTTQDNTQDDTQADDSSDLAF